PSPSSRLARVRYAPRPRRYSSALVFYPSLSGCARARRRAVPWRRVSVAELAARARAVRLRDRDDHVERRAEPARSHARDELLVHAEHLERVPSLIVDAGGEAAHAQPRHRAQALSVEPADEAVGRQNEHAA